MPKADWGGGLGGAASGASMGFSVGGPIGGAIGGIAGGIAGLFGGKKKKKKPKQISRLDPNQKKLNDMQYSSILGEGPLADLYNYNPEQANSVFDQTVANPQWRNFAEKAAPTITGSFRNQGLQNSSYVGDSLSKAGRDIQETLSGQRSQYLYNLENDARGAKRNAIENFQNRQTFDFQQPQAGQKSGNSLNDIISSLSGNKDTMGYIQDLALKYMPGGV